MFTRSNQPGGRTARVSVTARTGARPEPAPYRMALRLAVVLAAAFAAYLLGADPALAQSDIGSAGDSLLTDLGSWILIGTVGGGILAFVKGRTAIGIMVLIGGVILWGITSDNSVVQGLSDSIWGIFGG